MAGPELRLGGPAQGLPPAWNAETPEPLHAERFLARLAASAIAEAREPLEYSPEQAADDVAGLLKAFACGAKSPSDLLGDLRGRIAASVTGREAVLALLPEAHSAAEDSTRRWREGRARPLEGVPFGIKDIIDVAGAPVTCGSVLTGDRRAERDATVVARLRAAGAIPFAMLATTEFACGSPHNPRYGVVRNPYDPTRWTGGSSTGSGAALAARLLPLALGSDTGGSIRIPSAWCGTTGLKPTRGLVPRTGVAPLSWTLDHVGPMARSCHDLAAVMAVIAGPDGADPTAGSAFHAAPRDGFAGLRVGMPKRWFDTMCDAAVLAAWREALALLERGGARLIPVDTGDMATAHADGWTILLSELASMQEPAADRLDLFDRGTRHRILQGQAISAQAYLGALRRRPGSQKRLVAALAEVDVMITPGVGGEAGFLETLDVDVDGARIAFQDLIPRNTMVFDYTGLPALMLPSGVGRTGLPVAIQIVGKPFADGLCLAVGAAFQAATAHHRLTPPACP